MLARDIMSTRVELINRNAKLVEAAQMMANFDIGLLPVVDHSHVVGMLTDRDLVVRAMARGVDPHATEVDLIMTQGVVSCNEETPLAHVAELMERHGLRRLLVMDGNGQPSGVIAVEDLATRAADKQLAASALYRGSGTGAVEKQTR
jgi:CBS domain-containing protein